MSIRPADPEGAAFRFGRMGVDVTRFLVVGVAALVATGGCGDPVLAPDDVSGQYQARSFIIVVNGVTNELLSRGATVSLRLNPDLTTSGHITMPIVAGVQIVPVDDDLTGTYTLNKGVVRLSQGNAYLDGISFTADPPDLRAFISLSDGTRSGTFNLVLTRR